MNDVAPELLEAINAAFQTGYEDSDLIAELLGKVQAGEATYEEANLFAETVGDLLADCFKQNLSADVLPDGRMYYNIAKRVVEPQMVNNYGLISDYSAQVQGALNQKAGIGIAPQKATLNQDRIDGIINRMTSEENFDKVSWILQEPVTNFSMAVVDDTIQKNVDFQYRAGLSPKIYRKEVRGCCEWCRGLSGEYNYPDVPEDVYRRHQNCRCRVEYDPADGKKKRQDVHTKEWRKTRNNDIIQNESQNHEHTAFKRKVLGLKLGKTQITDIARHTFEQMKERGLQEEDIIDTVKNPLLIKDIKYGSLGRPSFQAVGKRSTISVNPENGIITTVWKTSSKFVNKLEGKQNESIITNGN